MGYILTFDYHTHSNFSDGKMTIRDIVMTARKKGLKEIAITDHGPGQIEHGLYRDEIPEMRRQVEELNSEFDDIKVYLGVEANIVHVDKNLDVLPEEFPLFDFVHAGYHNSVPNAYSHENWNAFHRGWKSDKLLMTNTEMTAKAIYENDIKILTHPGGGYHLDIVEIAKACAEKGTWMEINNSNRNLSVEQIRKIKDMDVTFVISSDAHVTENIGECRLAMIRALDAGLDPERIINVKEVEEL